MNTVALRQSEVGGQTSWCQQRLPVWIGVSMSLWMSLGLYGLLLPTSWGQELELILPEGAATNGAEPTGTAPTATMTSTTPALPQPASRPRILGIKHPATAATATSTAVGTTTAAPTAADLLPAGSGMAEVPAAMLLTAPTPTLTPTPSPVARTQATPVPPNANNPALPTTTPMPVAPTPSALMPTMPNESVGLSPIPTQTNDTGKVIRQLGHTPTSVAMPMGTTANGNRARMMPRLAPNENGMRMVPAGVMPVSPGSATPAPQVIYVMPAPAQMVLPVSASGATSAGPTPPVMLPVMPAAATMPMSMPTTWQNESMPHYPYRMVAANPASTANPGNTGKRGGFWAKLWPWGNSSASSEVVPVQFQSYQPMQYAQVPGQTGYPGEYGTTPDQVGTVRQLGQSVRSTSAYQSVMRSNAAQPTRSQARALELASVHQGPDLEEMQLDESMAAVEPEPGDGRVAHASQPVVKVRQVMPPVIQVGSEMPVELIVQNMGKVPVSDVQVVDTLGPGLQYVAAEPAADIQGDRLFWTFAELAPGQKEKIQLRLKADGPIDQEKVECVATVAYQSSMVGAVQLLAPRLQMTLQPPIQASVQEPTNLNIVVTNVGNVLARQARLVTNLPQQLSHPAGTELIYEMGDLAIGESRTIDLELLPLMGGRIPLQVEVQSANASAQVQETLFLIDTTEIQLEIEGPRQRAVEKNCLFSFTVAHQSGGSAPDLQLAVQLPDGISFEHAAADGEYNPALHQIYWQLGTLPPGERKIITVSGQALVPGKQKCLARLMQGDVVLEKAEWTLEIFDEAASTMQP